MICRYLLRRCVKQQRISMVNHTGPVQAAAIGAYVSPVEG